MSLPLRLRLVNARTALRRCLRDARDVVDALLDRHDTIDLQRTTAAWHVERPSHPSMLCRCGDDGTHVPDCEWLELMCSQCVGTGYCSKCQGDGCEPRGGTSGE
jgi:hypothetical protein